MKDQDDPSSGLSKQKRTSTSKTGKKRDRKGWISQSLHFRERVLGRQRDGIRISGASGGRRPPRLINLNKYTPQPGSSATKALDIPHSCSSPPTPPIDLKRKFVTTDTNSLSRPFPRETAVGVEDILTKKIKCAPRVVDVQVENMATNAQNDAVKSRAKKEKEKRHQKKKKKRQKADKQVRDEEVRQTAEDAARRAEAESSEAKRFFVGMPLASVGGLSGGSVCSNFRKRDLTLNDILPVPIESLLASLPARTLYESLKGPIYFSVSCEQNINKLKGKLKNAVVCSKLLVVTEEHFDEVVIPGVSSGGHLPRLLSQETLVAIERVLEDIQPPHGLESSQNAEDKIKYLFKPILKSLGLHDTIITTGFSWREKIGLRSTIDLNIHDYGPKSDAAIIKILSDEEARILVLFEAYSRLGQSLNTPDENRADRVRLLIQGSYISVRDRKPSVVYYLTRDKYMETILIFCEDEEQSKFGYYAEKQPFYDEVTWVDLVCQIINLV